MTKVIECPCGVTEEVDDDVLRTECFKHHVQGVTFNWVGGGGYGRESFHESTIAEQQREIVEGAAANGVEVEPVGRRWV